MVCELPAQNEAILHLGAIQPQEDFNPVKTHLKLLYTAMEVLHEMPL